MIARYNRYTLNEKSVNKQCLLNTPRSVTAYHKTQFFTKTISSCKCPIGLHVCIISHSSIKNCGRVDRHVNVYKSLETHALTCKKAKTNCLKTN